MEPQNGLLILTGDDVGELLADRELEIVEAVGRAYVEHGRRGSRDAHAPRRALRRGGRRPDRNVLAAAEVRRRRPPLVFSYFLHL